MTERPAILEGEIFDLLFTSANLSKFAPEEKIKYLSDMTTERDIRNQIAYAKDEGFEKGIEQGFEQGIEQGIEKGIEQGIAQRNAEIAKAMLAEGIDIATISKCTGLAPEEIASLQ